MLLLKYFKLKIYFIFQNLTQHIKIHAVKKSLSKLLFVRIIYFFNRYLDRINISLISRVPYVYQKRTDER